MPINPSPSYHGYDVTDYYDVNPQYGTRDDFRRLLAECHRRGIRVIVDLVLNHSSSRHPQFKAAHDKCPEEVEFRAWYGYTSSYLSFGRDEDAANKGLSMLRQAVDDNGKQAAAHRKEFLQDELRRRKPSESLVLLTRMLKDTPEDGELEFFKGEALRQRAGEGDLQRAVEVYGQAASRAGAPPEVYRSLGLVESSLSHGEASQAAFRRYLELKPDAQDAAMIRSYLEGGSR